MCNTVFFVVFYFDSMKQVLLTHLLMLLSNHFVKESPPDKVHLKRLLYLTHIVHDTWQELHRPVLFSVSQYSTTVKLCRLPRGTGAGFIFCKGANLTILPVFGQPWKKHSMIVNKKIGSSPAACSKILPWLYIPVFSMYNHGEIPFGYRFIHIHS